MAAKRQSKSKSKAKRKPATGYTVGSARVRRRKMNPRKRTSTMAKKRKRTKAKKSSGKRRVRRRSNPGIPVVVANSGGKRRRRSTKTSPGAWRRTHRFKRRSNPGGAFSKVSPIGIAKGAALLLVGGGLAVFIARTIESKIAQPPKVLAAIEAAAGVAILAGSSFGKLKGIPQALALGAVAGMGFSASGKAYDAFTAPPPASTPAAGAAAPPPAGGAMGAIDDGYGYPELEGAEGALGAVEDAYAEDAQGDDLYPDDLYEYAGDAGDVS